MQVGVSVAWHVEVEHDVDLLDINTTAKELSGDEDAVSELFEALVNLNSKPGWKRQIARNELDYIQICLLLVA